MKLACYIEEPVVYVPWTYGCKVTIKNLATLSILKSMGRKFILPQELLNIVTHNEGKLEFNCDYEDNQYPSSLILFYICSDYEDLCIYLNNPEDIDFSPDIDYIEKYKLWNTRYCECIIKITEYEIPEKIDENCIETWNKFLSNI